MIIDGTDHFHVGSRWLFPFREVLFIEFGGLEKEIEEKNFHKY
jgi:hypothetical protein